MQLLLQWKISARKYGIFYEWVCSPAVQYFSTLSQQWHDFLYTFVSNISHFKKK
jgi:hypothetical protein